MMERALEIGKAGEHLVCADLIMSGYRAFLSDQGLPYDVVVDLDGRMVRVQVRSTLHAKNVNSQGRNERIAYTWSARRRGKFGSKRMSSDHCDVVAFVALDIRVIAYLPLRECGQNVQLSPPGAHPEKSVSPRTFSDDVAKFPFADAVGSDRVFRLGSSGECPNGHACTPENTYFMKGKYRVCRICSAEFMRKRRSARKAAA
jgi:hypothetical protein